MMSLLQIYCSISRWEKNENRRAFGNVMGISGWVVRDSTVTDVPTRNYPVIRNWYVGSFDVTDDAKCLLTVIRGD